MLTMSIIPVAQADPGGIDTSAIRVLAATQPITTVSSSEVSSSEVPSSTPLTFTQPTGQIAEPQLTGAEIFEIHCAGCHIQGGNIIRRGKTLKLKALRKYGMDSIAAITEIVTNGKANMSAYRDRLTPAAIQTVAAYVLQQAETDWLDQS